MDLAAGLEWKTAIGFERGRCHHRLMTAISRTSAVPALLVAICSVFAAAHCAAAAPEAIPFSQRDGEAEAKADVLAERSTKLYSAVFNGRAPGFRTPGIIYCDPRYTGGRKSRVTFAALPEADWQEPSPFPPQYEAATQFARRYNQTMFRARKADIKSTCPKARLET
ncbi:hypothetical protein U1769_02185 [Sphingomonas sp. ZT3P38]|uniref:hypothetical protein n=1 Tax=Parasphingomonas zepuensis TaxID=3096161 RepID=UPI002FC87E12